MMYGVCQFQFCNECGDVWGVKRYGFRFYVDYIRIKMMGFDLVVNVLFCFEDDGMIVVVVQVVCGCQVCYFGIDDCYCFVYCLRVCMFWY